MNWLCVRVGPHKEAFASGQLANAGVVVYYPKYQRWVKHARQRKLVLRPLFPNYIFVHIDDDSRGLVARTPGVQSFVGGVQSPSYVPEELIALMQMRENEDGVVDLNREMLRSGDKIAIFEGPFTGFEAVFLEYDDKKRVNLLVEFLGKQHRVKLAEKSVARKTP
jgi:transcriptional antiterminator RfaH